MSSAGLFSVSAEEMLEAAKNTEFISNFFNTERDFVRIIPEEVSDKIFLFLPAKEVLACCCVSSAWRKVINKDLQWKTRCTSIGWNPEIDDTSEWSKLESHVEVGTKMKRPSPEWSISTVASLNMKPCCAWGKYFRECLHLRWNWRNGYYVTIPLGPSGVPNPDETCSAVASNGEFLAMGTARGAFYLWRVSGIPMLCQTVMQDRPNLDIEQIRMNKNYLAVFHQYGLLRVFQFTGKTEEDKIIDLVFENRVWAMAVDMQEFSLFNQEIKNGQVQGVIGGADENMNVLEMWIHELFLENPWFETEYNSRQMSLNLTDKHLILTGHSCNCFLVWDLATRTLLKKVIFPQGVRAGRLSYANSEVLCLLGKRRVPQQLAGSIFVYYLNDPFEFVEIRAENVSEEIRIHPSDNDRLIWFSLAADVNGINVKNQEVIFTRSNNSCVDNPVVYGSYIHYHLYDGGIVTLNWKGELLYETVSHIGRLQGIVCYNEYLVSGGDNKQLTVSDIHTGKLLHTLEYQPCRIHSFFVEDTKIITVSKTESPLLFGFW